MGNAIAELVRKYQKAPVNSMEHIAFVPPENPVGNAIQQYANYVAPRLAHPLETLASEARRFTRMSPQELTGEVISNMNPVGGLVAHTAWHGSPHLFEKFANHAIGTGEGAQAYGMGHYLAEAPEVAQGYRATVAPKVGDKFGLKDGEPAMGIAHLIAARGDKGEEMARRAYAELGDNLEPTIQRAKAAIDENSYLYKTDIPDEHINRMLDWDKPLSEQSGVAKVMPHGGEYGGYSIQIGGHPITDAYPEASDFNDLLGRLTGADAYNALAKKLGGQTEASKHLSDNGLKGIKYLDGSSRTSGEGTRNFVIFNPDDIRILERNGVPTGQKPWAETNSLLPYTE